MRAGSIGVTMTSLKPGGIVIAGERSGVGKTTVTLALLAALGQRSKQVQSFKVGPDYIDPMFHQRVTGRPCYNLDPILTSETYVQQSFSTHCRDAEFAVVEGVMGLFDGASGSSDVASTAHIAKLLNLPVLLVVDCSRLSRSVLAIIHGYRTLDPALHLAGVILNKVGSDRHLDLLKTALQSINLPILGVLRRQDAITIPDRHLGLVPTAELPHLQELINRLTTLGQHTFHWPLLLPLARTSPPHSPPPTPPFPHSPLPSHPSPRIAIAHDSAFSFYYPDNLEILQSLGVELVYWSPLKDHRPPENIQGFYFGGGFPEMFAAELANNQLATAGVRALIQSGLPTHAECGGLMYLAETLIDLNGQSWPMVGALPTTVKMEPRLTLGYRQATALVDSLLIKAGTSVWGHEFHRSQTTRQPVQPLYSLKRFEAEQAHAQEGWGRQHIHASYVHLHWGGSLAIAQSFVKACRALY
jgi:cobyrinic acid a,c-diamide synthase